MLEIFLRDLQFFSYHGVHEEEKILGGKFSVDLLVRYQPLNKVTQIEDTINYVTLYELLKARMAQPEKLLETLAFEMCHQVLDRFILAEEVQVTIKKLHPPIVAFQGVVGVSYKAKRNH